jgi:hypothetical protein
MDDRMMDDRRKGCIGICHYSVEYVISEINFSCNQIILSSRNKIQYYV